MRSCRKNKVLFKSPTKQLDYINMGFLVFCGGSLATTGDRHIDEKNWGLQVYRFEVLSTERAIMCQKDTK